MPGIGIVGAGIAGLHLGLFLLQHGVSATIYTEREPDEIRAGRLPNTVQLAGHTRARDRALGVNHWDAPGNDLQGMDFHIGSEPPIVFRGTTAEPFLFIDMRMYLPRLLEDFAARGGKVVRVALDAEGVARLAHEHDLMVIATGRAGLCDLFPRIAERSPFDKPQRTLFAGMFRGIRHPAQRYIALQLIPGQGEIYDFQFLSTEGMVRAMLIEGIPGGAIDAVTSRRYEDDPAGFIRDLYDVLQAYAPQTRERLDRDAFDVTGPLDVLSGAITPVVRRHYVRLRNDRLAVALGDALMAHDPLAGQGANAASHAGWLFGELVVERLQQGGALDEAFCAHAEQRLWEALQPAAAFSNALLMEPPPHVISMFIAATQSSAVADAVATRFGQPARIWAAISSPEGMERFLASTV